MAAVVACDHCGRQAGPDGAPWTWLGVLVDPQGRPAVAGDPRVERKDLCSAACAQAFVVAGRRYATAPTAPVAAAMRRGVRGLRAMWVRADAARNPMMALPEAAEPRVVSAEPDWIDLNPLQRVVRGPADEPRDAEPVAVAAPPVAAPPVDEPPVEKPAGATAAPEPERSVGLSQLLQEARDKGPAQDLRTVESVPRRKRRTS